MNVHLGSCTTWMSWASRGLVSGVSSSGLYYWNNVYMYIFMYQTIKQEIAGEKTKESVSGKKDVNVFVARKHDEWGLSKSFASLSLSTKCMLAMSTVASVHSTTDSHQPYPVGILFAIWIPAFLNARSTQAIRTTIVAPTKYHPKWHFLFSMYSNSSTSKNTKS